MSDIGTGVKIVLVQSEQKNLVSKIIPKASFNGSGSFNVKKSCLVGNRVCKFHCPLDLYPISLTLMQQGSVLSCFLKLSPF